MRSHSVQDKISKETKWLLKQKKNPSNDLHALIYEVEEFNFNKKGYSEYAEPLSSKDNLFNCLFGHYSYNFDYPEKVELVDSYFKEFGKKWKKILFTTSIPIVGKKMIFVITLLSSLKTMV